MRPFFNMQPFVLLFLLMPFIELYFMIEIGAKIGGFNVILLILASGVLGLFLMRTQGLATLQKAQQLMSMGQPPEKEMLEGIFIFIGGVLLLIPGFITDFMGIFFLIPPVRRLLIAQVIKQKNRQGHYYETNVFEGEFEEVTPHQKSLKASAEIIEGEAYDKNKKKD